MRTNESFRQTHEDSKYFVSDMGRVVSLAGRLPIILKPAVKDNGYLFVGLSGVANLVHRLVATAFIENPNGLPEVNHLDFNKTNNRASNLAWSSHAENMAHARAGGRFGFRADHPMAKLTEKDVVFIRSQIAEGKTQSELAALFGVQQTTISAIRRNKIWKEAA